MNIYINRCFAAIIELYNKIIGISKKPLDFLNQSMIINNSRRLQSYFILYLCENKNYISYNLRLTTQRQPIHTL